MSRARKAVFPHNLINNNDAIGEVEPMNEILPQQRLLLEVLVMSGDIAVKSLSEDSLIWRTLKECEKSRWIEINEFCPGFYKVNVTESGRLIGKEGEKS